jgi:drug/metabolite transporter (DMT)-like permease
MPRDNLRRGALYMLGSALLFSIMGALIKIVSTRLPNEMVVFFRSAMGLLVLMPWLWHRGLHRLHTRRFGGQLIRALAGLAAMYCYFYAIAHLTLAEATLLNYSTPLFVPFIAAFWLKERIPASLGWILAIGLAGILLILKPGAGLFTPVALIGLASGMFAAVAMVGIRRLTRTDSAASIVFYFSAISAAVSAVPLLWTWQTPDPGLWILLVLMGMVASVAQLLLTRAYACAPAAQVGPLTYITVVFAALVGWIFWGEVPDGYTVLGAGMVILGGVLAIRRFARFNTGEPPPPRS